MSIEKAHDYIDSILDRYEKGEIDDLYFYEHYSDYNINQNGNIYLINHQKLENVLSEIRKKYTYSGDKCDDDEIIKTIKIKNRDITINTILTKG